MLNVYIAAHNQEEALKVRDLLRSHPELSTKLKITSRWMDLPDQTGYPERTLDEWKEIAARDIEDLDKSDCLILVSDNGGERSTGGKHVEFGYALANYWPTIVYGQKECVFHHAAGVQHCTTPEQLIHVLSDIACWDMAEDLDPFDDYEDLELDDELTKDFPDPRLGFGPDVDESRLFGLDT